MAWSVMMSTATDFPTPIAHPALHDAPAAGGTITVFDGRSGQVVSVPRYRREQLRPGARLPGPALIAEDETSTFVTDGFDVWIDGLGSIVMDRRTSIMSNSAGLIEKQIMWNRCLALVEEQAQVLQRTAFSTIVRESGDLAAGPVRRQGPHDGAGRHRHARPHQLDGAGRRARHRQAPGGDDAPR